MEKPDSKYHKWLKKILCDFSQENKSKIIREKQPIKLTSKKRHSKSIIEYNPDYLFKFKVGRRSFSLIIFEFLDSQDYEGIFTDIIECACIENCRILLFLSKEPEKHKLTEDIIDIVSNSIGDLKGKDALEIVNLHIPMSMDKEKVKDEIYKEINKRVTLPKQPFILGKSRLGSPRNVLK